MAVMASLLLLTGHWSWLATHCNVAVHTLNCSGWPQPWLLQDCQSADRRAYPVVSGEFHKAVIMKLVHEVSLGHFHRTENYVHSIILLHVTSCKLHIFVL